MAALAVILSACGFTPAYGPDGNANTLTRNIKLTEPDTRQDYLLAQQVERRLGRAENADYTLNVDTVTTQDRIAVTGTNVTRRFEIIGSANYTLTGPDGALVTSGMVSSFTGYSATGSTVATTAARRDAQERLMVILADQIVTRMIAAAPAG
ncbi:LPS assembly lipoprotein LptE [Pseudooceanicola sp. MF1-13]|uniref:LPS assembly lipoprotein LptE n=1 Tax=Pseudooceanicola sp. MF1-13 TaxID=3379095 RepID=UPI0038919205